MIKGWLTATMKKDIQNNVKYAPTAKEIWDDLEEIFGQRSTHRAYELKCALTTLIRDIDSISTHFTKMWAVWDDILSASPTPSCTCDKSTCDIGKRLTKSKDKERVYEFMMGLKDTFGTIKTQILSTKHMP